MALPHGALGCSAVCEFSISWSYSFNFSMDLRNRALGLFQAGVNRRMLQANLDVSRAQNLPWTQHSKIDPGKVGERVGSGWVWWVGGR